MMTKVCIYWPVKRDIAAEIPVRYSFAYDEIERTKIKDNINLLHAILLVTVGWNKLKDVFSTLF